MQGSTQLLMRLAPRRSSARLPGIVDVHEAGPAEVNPMNLKLFQQVILISAMSAVGAGCRSGGVAFDLKSLKVVPVEGAADTDHVAGSGVQAGPPGTNVRFSKEGATVPQPEDLAVVPMVYPVPQAVER